MFPPAAKGETIQAFGPFQNMGGVGPTRANLKEAIEGETYEFPEMYPRMVEQAIREGHKAKTMLDWATGVEKVHAKLFSEALAALESGQDLTKMEVFICPVCGDLEFGVPEKCPVCGAAGSKFERVS